MTADPLLETRERVEHVVVFGATGNVGSATLRALASDDRVERLTAVARRPAPQTLRDRFGPHVTWRACDIATDDLSFIEGADVVIDLAWMIQPQHDTAVMARTNIDGTRRLLAAVGEHGIPALIYASSVGAYAPGPKKPVSETWPATGIPTSIYSRHKAAVESMLDDFEPLHPGTRVVRMRTSLVFQRSAASEIHRLFLGAAMPWHLPKALRFIPDVDGLTFQATHADDIADAYHRAVVLPVSGAFNIAADPALDPQRIAEAVGGRTVPFPRRILRAAVAATFAIRLQRSEAGWLDMATKTPLMDTTRAAAELGWSARRSSTDALVELLDGIGAGTGDDTVPLQPRRTGRISRLLPF